MDAPNGSLASIDSKFALKCNQLSTQIYTRRLANSTAVNCKQTNAATMSPMTILPTTMSPTTMSPVSLLFVLGMFYKGTTETTEKELFNLLGYNKSQFFENLIVLRKCLKNLGLGVTNGIYVNKMFEKIIIEDYCKALSTLDSAAYDTFDSNNANSEVKRINTFIEKHTNGLITDLVEQDHLAQDVIFLLLNTIYFKSNWEEPFDKKLTEIGHKFYSDSTAATTNATATGGAAVVVDNQSKVDMMVMCDTPFPYFYDNINKCKILEMNYANSSCSMGFVLPDIDASASSSASSKRLLDARILQNYWSNLTLNKIKTLKIPKFKIEHKIDLIPVLQSFGVNKMFQNSEVGDLLKQTNKPTRVSSLFQKAIVIVDEEGTEAAAATACVYFNESCSKGPSFVADHPFTFYIRDKQTNLLLFLGEFC